MVGRRNCIPIPEVFDGDVPQQRMGGPFNQTGKTCCPKRDIPNSGSKPKAGTAGTPVMNRSFLLARPAFLYLILYDSLVTLMKKPLKEKIFTPHITKKPVPSLPGTR
jgi:hypothetical protein